MILLNNQQKIPFWKIDIVQNLNIPCSSTLRKTYISEPFHLKISLITENHTYNELIFK